ncbi:hypothetical protein ASE61_14970 [Bosea sp. Root670]|nr:hypothetical protein ASE61_14970 [Bosea sp. Root670]
MSAGRFLTLPPPAVSETAAGHLPPARVTSSEPAAFPSCPDCKGRGHRITTHDGTFPDCISCSGSGRLVAEGARS